MIMNDYPPSGMNDEHPHGYQPPESDDYNRGDNERDASAEPPTAASFSEERSGQGDYVAHQALAFLPTAGRSFDTAEFAGMPSMAVDHQLREQSISQGASFDVSQSYPQGENFFLSGAHAHAATSNPLYNEAALANQLFLEQQPPHQFDAAGVVDATLNPDVLSQVARLPTNEEIEAEEESDPDTKPAANPAAKKRAAASAKKKSRKAKRPARKPSTEELREAKTHRPKAALDTWYKRLEQLAEYKAKHGDCLVPQKYSKNPQLGIWVNKQRMEYKNWQNEERSSLTEAKINALEEVGFVWAKQKGDVSWEERFAELLDYKQKHGNCDVPTKGKDQKALGRWVSTQRSQYKLFKKGQKSIITQERIDRLETEGFSWDLGTARRSPRNQNSAEVDQRPTRRSSRNQDIAEV